MKPVLALLLSVICGTAAAQSVAAGANSSVNSDGTSSGLANAGASTCSGASTQIGADAGAVPWNGYLEEIVFYSLGFSSGQITSMTSNQQAYG